MLQEGITSYFGPPLNAKPRKPPEDWQPVFRRTPRLHPEEGTSHMRILYDGNIHTYEDGMLGELAPRPDAETSVFLGPPKAGKTQSLRYISRYLRLKRVAHDISFESPKLALHILTDHSMRNITKGLFVLERLLVDASDYESGGEYRRIPKFRFYDNDPLLSIPFLEVQEIISGKTQGLDAYMHSIRPWIRHIHTVVAVNCRPEASHERHTRMGKDLLEAYQVAMNNLPRRLSWLTAWKDQQRPLVYISIDSSERTPLETAGIALRSIGTAIRAMHPGSPNI